MQTILSSVGGLQSRVPGLQSQLQIILSFGSGRLQTILSEAGLDCCPDRLRLQAVTASGN